MENRYWKHCTVKFERKSVSMFISNFIRYNMTPGTRHILAQLFPGALLDPGEPEDELADRTLDRSCTIVKLKQ